LFENNKMAGTASRSGPVRAVGASQPFQGVEESVQLAGLQLGLRGRLAGWKFRRTPGDLFAKMQFVCWDVH
jgi:hypothetical protein